MKIQAVVVLAAFLLLTTLVTESDRFSGTVCGKRELIQGKVWKSLLFNLLTVYLAFINQLDTFHRKVARKAGIGSYTFAHLGFLAVIVFHSYSLICR